MATNQGPGGSRPQGGEDPLLGEQESGGCGLQEERIALCPKVERPTHLCKNTTKPNGHLHQFLIAGIADKKNCLTKLLSSVFSMYFYILAHRFLMESSLA